MQPGAQAGGLQAGIPMGLQGDSGLEQGLMQAVNQVMGLMAVANQQGVSLPGLDRALFDLMRAFTRLEGGRARGFGFGMGDLGGFSGHHHHRHHHHRHRDWSDASTTAADQVGSLAGTNPRPRGDGATGDQSQQTRSTRSHSQRGFAGGLSGRGKQTTDMVGCLAGGKARGKADRVWDKALTLQNSNARQRGTGSSAGNSQKPGSILGPAGPGGSWVGQRRTAGSNQSGQKASKSSSGLMAGRSQKGKASGQQTNPLAGLFQQAAGRNRSSGASGGQSIHSGRQSRSHGQSSFPTRGSAGGQARGSKSARR